jgi:hypothetical protein
MPDERQLIEQAKQLLGQLTPDVRPISGAVLIVPRIALNVATLGFGSSY